MLVAAALLSYVGGVDSLQFTIPNQHSQRVHVNLVERSLTFQILKFSYREMMRCVNHHQSIRVDRP